MATMSESSFSFFLPCCPSDKFRSEGKQMAGDVAQCAVRCCQGGLRFAHGKDFRAEVLGGATNLVGELCGEDHLQLGCLRQSFHNIVS